MHEVTVTPFRRNSGAGMDRPGCACKILLLNSKQLLKKTAKKS